MPFEEAVSFDNEIVSYWSQLAGRDVSSPLFHLPLRMGGHGVRTAVQRHAAAPWTAWHSIIPTLMEATDSPDIDSLFAPTPILRSQLRQLQTTLAQQMNTPSLFLKSLGAELRMHGLKMLWSTRSNKRHTNNYYQASQPTPSRKAILLSQTAKIHWRAPTATQHRGLRSGRQMFPSLTRTTTQASPPSCESPNQHFTHVPQCQCGQTNMRLSHRPSPTTLHDLQKWQEC